MIKKFEVYANRQVHTMHCSLNILPLGSARVLQGFGTLYTLEVLQMSPYVAFVDFQTKLSPDTLASVSGRWVHQADHT